MQVVAQETRDHQTTRPARWVVSVPMVAVLALLLASLALRVLGLGAVPLSAGEVQPALAAYRDAVPGAAGESATASAPLLYWMQRIDFMTMGGSEFSARIGTALAGVALGLSPLLFAGLLGWTRAFLFAGLLTLSPVLLITIVREEELAETLAAREAAARGEDVEAEAEGETEAAAEEQEVVSVDDVVAEAAAEVDEVAAEEPVEDAAPPTEMETEILPMSAVNEAIERFNEDSAEAADEEEEKPE